MKPKAVIIDAMHLCYRHFFTKRNDKNSYKGETFVGMYHGFFTTLKFIRKKYPTHEIYVLWDSPTRKRYALFPEYKKKPKAEPEKEKQKAEDKRVMMSLLPDLKNMLEADGVHQLYAEGYEADDLAGYLVKHLLEDSNDIVLWTGDLDWAQLIQQYVTWVNTGKRNLVYNKRSFKETYGFPPEGLPLYKALTGDKSDNIKGIRLFPRKIAKILAERAVSVESFFYDRSILNDIPEKWREEIKDNASIIRNNFQLVSLYKEISNIQFTQGNRDKEKFEELSEKYGMESGHSRSGIAEFYLRKKREKREKEKRAE